MFFTWCLAVKSTWIQLGALGIGCRSCVLIFSIPMMPKKSCGISFFTSKMRVFAWEYSWGTAKRFIHGDKDWERETWMENTDCGRRSHLERTFFLLFLDFSLSWFFTRWDLLGSQIIHGLIFQIIYLSWSAIGVSPGIRFNGCGGKKKVNRGLEELISRERWKSVIYWNPRETREAPARCGFPVGWGGVGVDWDGVWNCEEWGGIPGL